MSSLTQTSGDIFLFRLTVILLPAFCILIFSFAMSWTIIKRYQKALTRLYQMNFQGVEFERKRIANDLHDYIGYTVASMKSSLSEIVEHSSTNGDAKIPVEKSLNLLTDFHTEIRHLIEGVYPRDLMDNNWRSSFQRLADGLSFGGKQVELFIEVSAELKLEQLHHLYRLTQELLANIFLHADVTIITVQMYEEGDLLYITFTHKGKRKKSFESLRPGRGSYVVTERLRILKGSMSVIQDSECIHQTLKVKIT